MGTKRGNLLEVGQNNGVFNVGHFLYNTHFEIWSLTFLLLLCCSLKAVPLRLGSPTPTPKGFPADLG